MKESDIKLGEWVLLNLDKEGVYKVTSITEDEKTGELLYDIDDDDNFILYNQHRSQLKKIPKRKKVSE